MIADILQPALAASSAPQFPELLISVHAVERYQQRVADLPEAAARAALDCPAARLAARIGAPFVKLPGGQRIVIRNATVITVLPPGTWEGSLNSQRNPVYD